ncbi:MAG: hypothetical protein K2W96_17735, partial [Gemmataceae bacterium]|nr:hypothetical protein [Gemmataceae bacterium]
VANALFSVVIPVFVSFRAPAAAPSLDKVLVGLLDRLGIAKDGEFTVGQLNAEVSKHSYDVADKRGEAAALAALKWYVLKDPDAPAFKHMYGDVFGLEGATKLKRSDIKKFADLLGEAGAKGDKARTLNGHFSRFYDQSTDFMNIGPKWDPTAIWGKDKTPKQRSESVRQGALGDCAFLAALIAHIRTVKSEDLSFKIIEIKDLPKGTPRKFGVRLRTTDGWRYKKVEMPTIAQRVLDGGSLDGSMWVSLYEKAYIQVRQDEDRAARRALYFTTGFQTVDRTYYQIGATGASMQDAITKLTGSPLPRRRSTGRCRTRPTRSTC